MKTSTVATDDKRIFVSLVYLLQYTDANSFVLESGRRSRIVEIGKESIDRRSMDHGAWSIEGGE